jgi:hypothetical protein
VSEGKQTTTQTFDPARQQFLDQIFGTPGTAGSGIQGPLGHKFGMGFTPGTPGTPGVGLSGLDAIFGPAASPLQRQATNQFGQFLNQESPQMQAYNMALEGLSGIAGGTGQFGNVAEALGPLFQRNLTEGISQLSSAAPGRFGSAFLQQGTNLAQRGMQDFNLFVEQARQQDIANQMQAFSTLGMLGGQAGMFDLQRLLGAGQLGAYGQQANLQRQLAILGLLGQPTGSTTRTGGNFLNFLFPEGLFPGGLQIPVPGGGG